MKQGLANYFEILSKLKVNELPLSARHAHFAGKIEWEHRDPFDRLLAAQATLDKLTLITNDLAFHDLSWINVLW
jgi:PIN domain nuclease of toxin-antitoxin system